MKFENVTSGEFVNVSGIKLAGEKIVSAEQGGRPEGARFCAKWAHIITEQHDEDGLQYFTVNEDWKVVSGSRKQRGTKTATETKEETAEPTNEHNEAAELPATKQATAQQATENNEKIERIEAELTAKYGNIGADFFAAARELVNETTNNAATETKVVKHTIQVLDAPEYEFNDEPHPLFDKLLSLVVNDRVIGRFPWLFGPAGSGKSTLAKQVAEALGLPFYSVSSLQQKYELEGYTDAAGELVKTSFYKAATEGGIFLFDEASTTSAEVQVAFNNMLANLVYNFPKEGMVNAHKDFHIIAADNTTGRGGNKTYSARFCIDASTLDRYICLAIDYTDKHDMKMADNDAELVKFIKDMRRAIYEAGLSYTASPRASKSIKAMQQMSCFTELEAFNLGLCASWKAQDIKTLNTLLNGNNKYYQMFNELAKTAK